MNTIEQYFHEHFTFIMRSLCEQRVSFQGTRKHIDPEFDSVDHVGRELELIVAPRHEDIKDGQKYEYVIHASPSDADNNALFGFVLDAFEEAGYPTDIDHIHDVLRTLEIKRALAAKPKVVIELVGNDVGGIYADRDMDARAIRNIILSDNVVETHLRDAPVDVYVPREGEESIQDVIDRIDNDVAAQAERQKDDNLQ